MTRCCLICTCPMGAAWIFCANFAAAVMRCRSLSSPRAIWSVTGSEGLKAGADDYIVKPFDLDEVNARLEAVSRRYFGKAMPVVEVGPVELEWESKVARLDGLPIELSAREWAVIEVLGRRRQSTVSKEQIEDALYAFGEEIESNTIEVYVSRIRRKLGRDFIRTIRGLGYRLGD